MGSAITHVPTCCKAQAELWTRTALAVSCWDTPVCPRHGNQNTKQPPQKPRGSPTMQVAAGMPWEAASLGPAMGLTICTAWHGMSQSAPLGGCPVLGLGSGGCG